MLSFLIQNFAKNLEKKTCKVNVPLKDCCVFACPLCRLVILTCFE